MTFAVDDTPTPIRRLALPEFTAMLAMLFATIAFSIDAMLPALPAIAAELVPEAANRAQLILSAFVFGMGAGTLFTGPISDALGRKPAIAGGICLYIAASVMAYYATSLEMLLVARTLQGLGVAGPRIAGLALTRDLYEGREMARVMSFVMTVFMVVPALAPAIGAGIIAYYDWRSVFLAFVIFGLAALIWVSFRQAETLPPNQRRALSKGNILDGLREVLGNREVRIYTAVLTLGYGQMFAVLSSIQQIFGETYGRAASFPNWFALIAVISAGASLLNSRLVMRIGMRRLALQAYLALALLSAVMAVVFWAGLLSGWLAFAGFLIWNNALFFSIGLTFGNLNALALQKMGHIAGMATSVISAISTILSVVIAAPVGLAFDGSPLPVVLGAVVCSGLSYILLKRTL